VIWEFGVGGGSFPESGVTLDSAGNLYGTTILGTVYELSPSNSGWTETTLTASLDNPVGGVAIDPHGDLFGTTGGNISGHVYELSPSNGGWTLNVLYSFNDNYIGPYDTPTLDAAGNVYGTSPSGGPYGLGLVFKLTPSNGSWIFTDLHDFNGSEGSAPVGGVVFDASGNMYGTTSTGGTDSQCNGGCGTVWEITP
jgi:uncharacterized repeat protein (TIGR03803 family)